MTEPTEPRKSIAPDNWAEFLEKFSRRNNNRRVRITIFKKDGSIVEEAEEAHLEDVKLKTDRHSSQVEIIRLNRSGIKTHKTEFVVDKMRGISVQYDTDDSEEALEITDEENSLVSLRFESKVDGVS